MERKQKPLEGITVVELAMFVAAPSAARMLADWGATVIKIESPKGDPMRFMGKLVSMPIDDERENPAYDQQNSGKRPGSDAPAAGKGRRLYNEQPTGCAEAYGAFL